MNHKMEQLLALLKDLKPDVDFEHEEHLIDDHILTSLDIMTLTMQICDTFDVELSPLDIVPENFQTVKAMYALITRLQEEN
jgi:acyl carrier protein